jgi:alpha-L-fucosidase
MQSRPSGDSIARWQDYKFGMFIHWGLYAIPGNGEWIMFNDQIDVDEYRKLMDEFKAEAFDASHWAQTAKDAGMKYMVLTSRHHDGFSLFDSKASVGGYTSMHAACERDIVGEYTTACRAAGLGVGLYYSPMDWRFPGFFAPKMYAKSAQAMKQQCHGQIQELMSNYGKIDILWYDGGNDFWLAHARDIRGKADKYTKENPQCPNFWDGDRLDEIARTRQPEILINERIGAMDHADFIVSEGKVGKCNFQQPWESCFTLAGAWGYCKGARPRPLRECIQTLIQTVVGGGNLLLNVGPRPDGRIEENQVERLKEIGEWLEAYGESVYGTRGGPIPPDRWGGTTWRENTLYVHILHWLDNTVRIPRGKGTILSCISLTGANVTMVEESDWIVLSVPSEDRLVIDTVLKIELDCEAGKAYERV